MIEKKTIFFSSSAISTNEIIKKLNDRKEKKVTKIKKKINNYHVYFKNHIPLYQKKRTKKGNYYHKSSILKHVNVCHSFQLLIDGAHFS